jgi:hypothetical protein
VLQDPVEHQRVDVAAAEDGDDGRLVGPGVGEQGGDRRGTGRFDQQLRPLEEQHDGLRQPLLGDGDDGAGIGPEVAPDGVERHVAGAGDRDPVGHGRHVVHSHRVAGGQRPGPRGRTRSLDADHADRRPLVSNGQGDSRQ